MLELLATYSLTEIVIFLVTLALAIKGLITFWDWAVERLRKVFNKETEQEIKQKQTEERLFKGDKKMQKLEDSLNDISKKLDILMSSDKDDIKSFIVREHHYFCYQKKWIDDYSLDCLERRFEHYKEEKGNSFAEDLMKELRALPKQPPQ